MEPRPSIAADGEQPADEAEYLAYIRNRQLAQFARSTSAAGLHLAGEQLAAAVDGATRVQRKEDYFFSKKDNTDNEVGAEGSIENEGQQSVNAHVEDIEGPFQGLSSGLQIAIALHYMNMRYRNVNKSLSNFATTLIDMLPGMTGILNIVSVFVEVLGASPLFMLLTVAIGMGVNLFTSGLALFRLIKTSDFDNIRNYSFTLSNGLTKILLYASVLVVAAFIPPPAGVAIAASILAFFAFKALYDLLKANPGFHQKMYKAFVNTKFYQGCVKLVKGIGKNTIQHENSFIRVPAAVIFAMTLGPLVAAYQIAAHLSNAKNILVSDLTRLFTEYFAFSKGPEVSRKDKALNAVACLGNMVGIFVYDLSVKVVACSLIKPIEKFCELLIGRPFKKSLSQRLLNVSHLRTENIVNRQEAVIQIEEADRIEKSQAQYERISLYRQAQAGFANALQESPGFLQVTTARRERLRSALVAGGLLNGEPDIQQLHEFKKKAGFYASKDTHKKYTGVFFSNWGNESPYYRHFNHLAEMASLAIEPTALAQNLRDIVDGYMQDRKEDIKKKSLQELSDIVVKIQDHRSAIDQCLSEDSGISEDQRRVLIRQVSAGAVAHEQLIQEFRTRLREIRDDVSFNSVYFRYQSESKAILDYFELYSDKLALPTKHDQYIPSLYLENYLSYVYEEKIYERANGLINRQILQDDPVLAQKYCQFWQQLQLLPEAELAKYAVLYLPRYQERLPEFLRTTQVPQELLQELNIELEPLTRAEEVQAAGIAQCYKDLDMLRDDYSQDSSSKGEAVITRLSQLLANEEAGSTQDEDAQELTEDEIATRVRRPVEASAADFEQASAAVERVPAAVEQVPVASQDSRSFLSAPGGASQTSIKPSATAPIMDDILESFRKISNMAKDERQEHQINHTALLVQGASGPLGQYYENIRSHQAQASLAMYERLELVGEASRKGKFSYNEKLLNQLRKVAWFQMIEEAKAKLYVKIADDTQGVQEEVNRHPFRDYILRLEASQNLILKPGFSLSDDEATQAAVQVLIESLEKSTADFTATDREFAKGIFEHLAACQKIFMNPNKDQIRLITLEKVSENLNPVPFAQQQDFNPDKPATWISP